MIKKSKTIQAWCEKNIDLVDEYLVDTDGHWVYFKEGFVHEEMECGTVREDTVSEAMKRLKRSLILTEKEFYGD